MNPILIVDDEAAIAMLVRRILTEVGLPLSGRDRQPRGGKSAGKEPL